MPSQTPEAVTSMMLLLQRKAEKKPDTVTLEAQLLAYIAKLEEFNGRMRKALERTAARLGLQPTQNDRMEEGDHFMLKVRVDYQWQEELRAALLRENGL